MTYVWFRANQQRLIRELEAVEHLQASTPWLVKTDWTMNACLSVDVIIRVHGHDYHVRMEYPAYFPDVPPTVRPVDARFRWSSHQYGSFNGPLCLEWGPDTWVPTVTGAQMLESVYSLFHQENPLGRAGTAYDNPAPSRHHHTRGQALRSEWKRFYAGHVINNILESLPTRAMGLIKFSLRLQESVGLALIHELQVLGDASVWTEEAIPSSLRETDNADLFIGVFFKTTLSRAALTDLKLPFHLRVALGSNGFDHRLLANDVRPNILGLTSRPSGALVIDNNDEQHFFFLLNSSLLTFEAVHTSADWREQRMPPHLKTLAEKSIAIVGVGSAGSKIAVSLARMGVSSFYLVDHDIFLPQNIERNELDWEDVGAHKIDGVKNHLLRVNAQVEVKTSNSHITGQESTAVIADVIDRLSEYDIIIDATASAAVFNVLAGVAIAAQKPLVWLEVFGGGKGGMIARSRPGRDLQPYLMRYCYSRYCEEHPAPEGFQLHNYAAYDVEGVVQIASDADVSIIAAHATRLAVDTVLEKDPSAYAYSLYLIGLEEWWVFTQAMHTIPIPTDQLHQEIPAEVNGLMEIQDPRIRALMNRLLDDGNTNANSTPS